MLAETEKECLGNRNAVKFTAIDKKSINTHIKLCQRRLLAKLSRLSDQLFLSIIFLDKVTMASSPATDRQATISRNDEDEESRFQRVLAGCTSGFEICQVEGIGRGIRTTRPFKRNDLLLRYFGDVVTEQEAKRRENAGPLVGHFYRYNFRALEKPWVLDATREDGSFGRLINHSKKHPNVKPKPIVVDGVPAVVFKALVDIGAGTELRYDYGIRKKEVLEANPWLKE